MCCYIYKVSTYYISLYCLLFLWLLIWHAMVNGYSIIRKKKLWITMVNHFIIFPPYHPCHSHQVVNTALEKVVGFIKVENWLMTVLYLELFLLTFHQFGLHCFSVFDNKCLVLQRDWLYLLVFGIGIWDYWDFPSSDCQLSHVTFIGV